MNIKKSEKEINRLIELAKEIEEYTPQEYDVDPDSYPQLSSVISNKEVLENYKKQIVSNEQVLDHDLNNDIYFKLDEINCRHGKKHMKIDSRFDILDL